MEWQGAGLVRPVEGRTSRPQCTTGWVAEDEEPEKVLGVSFPKSKVRQLQESKGKEGKLVVRE